MGSGSILTDVLMSELAKPDPFVADTAEAKGGMTRPVAVSTHVPSGLRSKPRGAGGAPKSALDSPEAGVCCGAAGPLYHCAILTAIGTKALSVVLGCVGSDGGTLSLVRVLM